MSRVCRIVGFRVSSCLFVLKQCINCFAKNCKIILNCKIIRRISYYTIEYFWRDLILRFPIYKLQLGYGEDLSIRDVEI